eukprot:1633104-Pleurochrysis_carterae.AAC.8
MDHPADSTCCVFVRACPPSQILHRALCFSRFGKVCGRAHRPTRRPRSREMQDALRLLSRAAQAASGPSAWAANSSQKLSH